jgi:drug/metabolite transporter (DMT)-like permease
MVVRNEPVVQSGVGNEPEARRHPNVKSGDTRAPGATGEPHAELAVSEGAKSTAYAAWIVVCLVWGTTYLAIRVALETIPPASVGAIRFIIAGVLLAVILAARGVALPARAHWRGLAIVGILLIGVGNGMVVVAEQWVPSGIAAVVIATTPFWMAGLEALIPGGERFSQRTLIGMTIGFAGILLLLWPDLMAGGSVGRQFLYGIVALQLAEIGWSGGTAYSRRHARGENALAAAALQMIFGGSAMLVVAVAGREWENLHFTARTAAAELYLIVVGSLVAFPAYIYALKHLPVATVSLYAYINPMIAVLLGALLLGEPFGMRIVIASALVLLGVGVVRGWMARRATARGATAA